MSSSYSDKYHKHGGKSSYRKSKHPYKSDKSKYVYIKNNPDEKDIDLSEVKTKPDRHRNEEEKDVQKTGVCEGCGEDDAPKRFITNEFICMKCRNDIQFKLITKTTISNLYPSVNLFRLRQAVDAGDIQAFKTLNWHNRNAPPIQLFYEKDIMELAGEDVQQTSVKYNQHRSKSKPHSYSKPKFIIEKV
jgi:hypothetical protein